MLKEFYRLQNIDTLNRYYHCMPWPLSTILFHEENEISRKYTCDVIQAIAFSMLNFKACGTPLNIMQSSKYFAQILFIVIGTTSKGGTVKLITFIFSPLAKGHPNEGGRQSDASLRGNQFLR